jgi:beta-lactam-binding protein with PASTA domain
VDLLLSDGPESEAYLLPDFSGGDPDPIARALRREGYVVEVIYPAGRFSPSRRVGGQIPPPGQRVVSGDKIKLIVGEG